MDIKDYLVHSTNFITRDQMKAYKALDAHNYLTSGWVAPPKLKVLPDGMIVVVGKARSRVTLLTPGPWLLVRADGVVELAHCTCMAGLGEACSHIAAVLFYLEAVVKQRDGTACTDVANSWRPVYVKNVACCPISKINFSSATAKKQHLDADEAQTVSKLRKNIPKPTTEEVDKFFAQLHASGAQSAILSITKGYAQDYIPTVAKYPTVLLGDLYKDDKPSSWEAVMAECDHIASRLSVVPELILNISMLLEEVVSRSVEADTKDQAVSSTWFAFRAGRVTASNARAACFTPISKPSPSLVKKMCYPTEHKFSTPATRWGIAKEPIARERYTRDASQCHMNFVCKKSGLHISPEHPYLAATPDGLTKCSCCGEGLLEIKCPFSCKSLQEVTARKDGCLQVVSGRLELKTTHSFFYQVQMQLMVCQKQFCDFVLWTTGGMHTQRVHLDEDFCDIMTGKCKAFFLQALLPELRFRYWTKAAASTPLGDYAVCHCGHPEEGRMVKCAGTDCTGRLFHFKCTGLKRVSKTIPWYCKSCSA
ncbi:unnamed protein product [Ixodes persulcatus]